MDSMRIGVFDSGKGGELIAARLATLLPDHEWVVVSDLEHVPYGEKDRQTIIDLTERAIAPLIADCPIIVIACNTATTAAISTLRQRHPHTQFVGVEPMVKPASKQSQNHHVTILATPYTLESGRYQELKATYGHITTIDEPDTRGWPKYIDDGQRDLIDTAQIDSSIAAGSDSIVLACTHYLDLIDMLSTRYPNIALLEPCEALARRIQQLNNGDYDGVVAGGV